MRGDQIGEQGLLAWIVLHERERAAGMDRDVIPRGHGERLSVERWGNIAVRPRKDDKGFPSGERLPMGIGFGEMAFKNAVLALVFDDQRKMALPSRSCPVVRLTPGRKASRTNRLAWPQAKWRDREPD